MLWKRFHASSKDIDGRLAVEVERRLDGFRVNVRELPRYRFVDFYRAAEHHCEAIGVKAAIESDHRDEYLGGILHSRPSRWISRRIRAAERVAWPVGPAEEVFLPVDVFWICGGAGREPHDHGGRSSVRKVRLMRSPGVRA